MTLRPSLPSQLKDAAMHLVVMVVAFPPLFILADWLRYS